MAEMPIAAHRHLIEPISSQKHMFVQLVQNYLGFVDRIKKSSKKILRVLFGICKEDVRTVTGCNLRNILLLTKAPDIDVLKKNDVRNLVYREADDNDAWRINLAKEIFEMRNGITEPIPGWKKKKNG